MFTVDTRDQTWVSPHDFSIHPQRDREREQRSCNVLIQRERRERERVLTLLQLDSESELLCLEYISPSFLRVLMSFIIVEKYKTNKIITKVLETRIFPELN